MEEQLEQKSSELQNSEVENPSYIGLLGGLTLITLPLIGIAAIIGLVKTIEFLDESDEDSNQDEVDNI